MKTTCLIWRDPDPIDGNDYRVTKFIPYEDDETALIHYGSGSEAEVFLSELEVIRAENVTDEMSTALTDYITFTDWVNGN